MLAHAMWVHGHSGRVEHPDRLESLWRAGFYVRLVGRPGQDTWVHYAIPTPVIVNDRRLRAGSVMVRLRSTPADAWISDVHIYDGERRIAAHDGRREAPSNWAWPRFDIPGDPEVRWGLGVSLHVSFADRSAAGGPDFRLEISAVGCDFLP